MNQLFTGVFREGNKILTTNLVPGFRCFSEELIKINNVEYRVWDPKRSKPAAAIMKGLKFFPIKKGVKILYLGIANGNTASFFSDIIGKEGIIYGIEISERSMFDLIPVAEKKGNIVPVLANAREPNKYDWIEPVDMVYQDVATNDQSEIIIRNAEAFLKKDGWTAIAIKARSIDVTKNPKEIYMQETKKLSEYFKIMNKVELDPYEIDHMFFSMRRRDSS